MNTTADSIHMSHALRLAARGLYTTDPNPRVGCVLVNGGEVVGEGWHRRAGEPHAEVHALRAAGERARGATAYVTLEPCAHHGRTPPCADALIAAGVARVVAGAADPNPVAGGGLARLEAAGIAVERGLMAAGSEALNPGFFRRLRTGLPHVRIKLAASLDGRTALVNGASHWITGAAARRDVQHWRARSSAVLTGVGTALADDPRLTVREPPEDFAACGCGGELRQPVRVVLDTWFRLPLTARMLREPGETWVFTVSTDPLARRELEAAGARVFHVPPGEGGTDLAEVMRTLGAHGVNEVLVEAGPVLCGALLRAGLAQELILYLAPVLMGDAARGLFHLPGFETLADCPRLAITGVRAVGEDWRIMATLQN